MQQHVREPLSVRLPWEEVHRLEVLMRTRAYSLSRHTGRHAACARCGKPLGNEGMRLAGLLVHPGCLPGTEPV